MRIVVICISIYLCVCSSVFPADYTGVIVQEVQVACVTAPERVKIIQKNIAIQSGEVFSSEKIRESIRKIYALKGFAQITVEADPVPGGVRLTFCPAQIKTISKIQITGNKTIPPDAIRNVLEITPGDRVAPAALEGLRQRVLKLYADRGYHHVQLTIQTLAQAGFEQVILALDIQEGAPSQIGATVFSGQTVFSAQELVKISKLAPGAQFSLEALEKGLVQVKKIYAEKGYLGVEVTNQEVQYDAANGAVSLNFTLNEGKPTDFRFEGNASFTAKMLKALLTIFTNQNHNEDILAENAATLQSYYQSKGFPFVNVTYHTVTEQDRLVIIFTIAEGAQTRVQQLVITGNHALTASQIRKLMLTETTGLFSKGRYQAKVLQDDLLAIKAFYQQQGYLEAEVVSVAKEFSQDQSQVMITLLIREGVQTQVTDIRILGETDEAALKQIRKRLLLENGAPLDINKVTQSVELLKEFYANQGYLNVAVDVSPAFTADHRQVSLTFRITPGKKFAIGKISIEGVFRTKEVFIKRNLRVKEGDVYNPAKIRETVRRLNQSGLYESVSFRRLDPKSEEPIQNMQLAVVETSTKDVQFGIGYSTELGLKGSVEYADKNVFNYGGKGAARAELSLAPKDFKLVQPKLTIQYQQPHFFTQDTHLLASLYDDIQKDNASFNIERRGGRLGVRHNFDDTLSVSAGYYFERAEPSNVNAAAQLTDLDARLLNIGGFDAGLTWDFRDDVIQTRKGGLIQVYLRTANTLFGSQTDFLEVNAETNWYLPLFQKYMLACALNGKLIKPTAAAQAVPIYNRYFLGGENTVRGFPKDSIGPTAMDAQGNQVYLGGDRLLRFNAELRFPIYSALGGVIFYDVGTNWLAMEGFRAENIRQAIGLGLRVATPVGPLRVDYGWKLQRRSGESAGDYYLTIGATF